MKCSVCNRILQQDARFCDYCGTPVPETREQGLGLNKKFLFISILASIGITLPVTLVAMGYGLPLFFGGLFLPFFFVRKRKSKP